MKGEEERAGCWQSHPFLGGIRRGREDSGLAHHTGNEYCVAKRQLPLPLGRCSELATSPPWVSRHREGQERRPCPAWWEEGPLGVQHSLLAIQAGDPEDSAPAAAFVDLLRDRLRCSGLPSRSCLFFTSLENTHRCYFLRVRHGGSVGGFF